MTFPATHARLRTRLTAATSAITPANQARCLWSAGQRSSGHGPLGLEVCGAKSPKMYRDSSRFSGPVMGLQGIETYRRSGFPPE
jgi:hypothetical protein